MPAPSRRPSARVKGKVGEHARDGQPVCELRFPKPGCAVCLHKEVGLCHSWRPVGDVVGVKPRGVAQNNQAGGRKGEDDGMDDAGLGRGKRIGSREAR